MIYLNTIANLFDTNLANILVYSELKKDEIIMKIYDYFI